MGPTTSADDGDEFEDYLRSRRRRRRALLIAGIVVFVGIVAIPYLLMRAGMIQFGTFEIFVAVDIFVAIGLVRAFAIRVKDSLF